MSLSSQREPKRLRKLNNPLKEDVLQAFDSILKDPLSYKALDMSLRDITALEWGNCA